MSHEPEFLTCIQGSEEWFEARRGIPTASRFDDVLRSGKGGGESKTRRTYLNQLAGEIITGKPMETYQNDDMRRGKQMEPQAILDYEYMRDTPVRRIGFVKGYRCGASPDGLVGPDGMVEIKTTKPDILIELLRTRPPLMKEHYAQCQGNLLIARRRWVDLCIFWPGLPMFKQRYELNHQFCAELEGQIHIFNKELDSIVAQIRDMAS